MHETAGAMLTNTHTVWRLRRLRKPVPRRDPLGRHQSRRRRQGNDQLRPGLRTLEQRPIRLRRGSRSSQEIRRSSRSRGYLVSRPEGALGRSQRNVNHPLPSTPKQLG